MASIPAEAFARPRNRRRGKVHETKAQDYCRRLCEAPPKRHLGVITKFTHRSGQRELLGKLSGQFSGLEYVDSIHAVFAESKRCRYRRSIDRMRIGD